MEALRARAEDVVLGKKPDLHVGDFHVGENNDENNSMNENSNWYEVTEEYRLPFFEVTDAMETGDNTVSDPGSAVEVGTEAMNMVVDEPQEKEKQMATESTQSDVLEVTEPVKVISERKDSNGQKLSANWQTKHWLL